MSRLRQPGGWIHSSRMAGGDNVLGARCAFCGHTIVGHAWVLVTEHSVACVTCLPDPNAQRGLAGRRALYRLRNRLDRERKERDWWEIL